VLDISRVVGGAKEGKPKIEKRLQPNINTRVAAVVLVSTSLGENGLELKGSYLPNKHAKKPLSPEAEAIIRTATAS
jgi:hypothetical protein